jgi:tripartite-type tricarboxylate transporter receptor subunit TctC
MNKRFFQAVAGFASLLACATVMAQGATYPVKPVRIIIPFPPGGSVDTLARAVGSELSRLWGQPVLVDGRPGAGGVTAAVSAARSSPDGYTLFLADEGPMTIVPFMQRDLPYDPAKDFVPVIALVQAARIVVVPGGYPVNSIRELIAAAKAKPGAINFGSWGVGSVAHLAAEDFATSAGISITHVPYKGAADLSRGLLSGEVQLAFHSLGAVMGQVKDGRLKAIAYAGLKRPPLLPGVPTVAESGLPGFQSRSWLGFVVPAGTPRTIIERIAADAGRVLAIREFKDKHVEGVGFEVFNLQPEPFAQLVSETRVKNGEQLKRLKLQAH